MFMRIPMYRVAFAPTPGQEGQDNIVLRVPQDHVDVIVRVLMMNGINSLSIEMEDGDATTNG